MRGYPKNVATKQDYLNLLAMPEYKVQAIEEMKKIAALNDSTVIKATMPIDPKDPDKGWNTAVVENPMPPWKQKGFASRQEVAEVILTEGTL
jgi:hypothetical protein